MKQITNRTVVSYEYKDERETEWHEKTMIKNGWRVESQENNFIKHFRKYSKSMRRSGVN